MSGVLSVFFFKSFNLFGFHGFHLKKFKLCLGTIGLIVAAWKFDVLKISIFALEALLLASWTNICFKNTNFPLGNYQPIVPRQKYSIVLLVWCGWRSSTRRRRISVLPNFDANG